MGTRGAWGFVLNGEEKLMYNQYDSYPDGLGIDILSWLRSTDLDALPARVAEMTPVNENVRPTAEELERFAVYHNKLVSTGSNWYALLRETQGKPEASLAARFFVSAADFPADSLFCEFAYVIDLDAGALEAYRGFQKATPQAGRWAGARGDDHSGYAAVELVASWPLKQLPTDDDFYEVFESFDDEDEG